MSTIVETHDDHGHHGPAKGLSRWLYTTNHKDKISPIYFTCLIIIGWFINSITWFRLGDAYSSYLLSKKANVQLSTLIGTIVAERFVDTAVIFLFLCISFALISLQSNFLNPIYLIIGGITLIILILLLIFLGIFRNFISKILPNIFTWATIRQ